MEPITDRSIFQVTADIYEGAAETNREAWQAAYERVSRMIGSGPGTIHFRYKADNCFDPIADTNSPGFIENFNELYFDLLPYREDFLNLRTGEEFMRTRDCPDDRFLQSELYRDHFEKLGIYEILHYCLFDDDAVTGGITFTRPKSVGAFTKDERRAVAEILPHIQKAARLHLKLVRANEGDRLMREAWDRVGHPVILLSNRRRAVFMNTAAEKLIKAKNGFWFGRNGDIETTDPIEASRLSRLIDGAFAPGAGKAPFGGRVLISRRDLRPLSLTITPFKERDRLSLGGERFALLMIADPESRGGTTEEDLRTAYNLTKSEARVAKLLAEGKTLAQVCETLGISQNTARTHLKRVYTKTNTNRQSSLVKLILSGSIG